MGRRKIEIKAIKDDRNRSVTFLKRKGGLFKKAHELSVLCSVDVAVFIFGGNKKLYEYSSTDMRELIHRYTYHGGPTEHKGPSDFNGGDDDNDDDDDGATPPRDNSMDPHMMPPHPQFPGGQFPPHMRHHTPSASPPIASVPFQTLPHIPRGHTPQPHGSRPASRTDMRRISAPMLPVPPPQGSSAPGAQPPPANGFAYIPQPAIYQPQNAVPMSGSIMPPHYPQYSAQPTPSPHPSPMPPHGFVDERRESAPPLLRTVPSRSTPSPPRPMPTSLPPPQPMSHVVSPPPPMPRQLPARPPAHELPPHVQHQQHQQQQQIPRQLPPLAPTASMDPEAEPNEMAAPMPPAHRDIAAALEAIERPKLPVLRTSLPKKLPQRKGGSIFTPIDDNKSILQQHFSSFAGETRVKTESDGSPGKVLRRSQTPPLPPRTWQLPETIKEELSITPPSRSSSIYIAPGPPSATARPQLKVQIPITASEAGAPTGGGSGSPHNSAVQSATKKGGGILLPPPSPSATASASALLSAGATGPPNPFARPQPRNTANTANTASTGSTGSTANNDSMNVDTPVSSLPSRFLNSEFLPSPSNFYQDFTFRGAESNTLPSPLNYATPLAASGPSFLREDPSGLLTIGKRKSPEISGLGHGDGPEMMEAKRVKVE